MIRLTRIFYIYLRKIMNTYNNKSDEDKPTPLE